MEILNPGWLSIVVDHGRYGFGGIGVPSSSALDQLAFRALNYITGNDLESPAIEVLGKGFAARFDSPVYAAITGARVRAWVDDKAVPEWAPFPVGPGSVLRIREVADGFRYYIGISGTLAIEKVIGSFSTNLECRFGGYKGRPLLKGDRLPIIKAEKAETHAVPADLIPKMNPPHRLRLIEGPEADFFTAESLKRFFAAEGRGCMVSGQSNRNGIRLEGEPLEFRQGADKSIISEGILPGTVQIPGDGLPIVTLHERTIGGYARLGTIARVDQDRLAHLKPGDRVGFERISLNEVEKLWLEKMDRETFLRNTE
jgi:antagonist of KipI